MFARDKPKVANKALRSGAPGLSFIGPEVVISGDIVTSAQLHIEGRIDGNVQCGQLCQGTSGAVAGNIVAEEARIAGLVEGAVFAKELTLEASARIRGDITYQSIGIAAGARIDGRLARRESLNGSEGSAPMLLATTIVESEPPPAEGANEAQALFPLPGPKQTAAG